MAQSLGEPPRISLIGVSGYAEVYIDWLLQAQREGRLQIAAATILPHERERPSALALGDAAVSIYDNYQSMFATEAGKLDLSFIPTGIQWHAPMTIAALEAGSNVLVEKPLAGSLADTERVQAAEQATGKWVAVGFQDMYTSEILELKQSLRSGIIGTLESVSMIATWPRPHSYYSRNDWAGKLEVNGQSVCDSPLNNSLAHFVNLALFLAGSGVDESVETQIDTAELYRARPIESFDTAVVQASSQQGLKFWFGATDASETSIEPRIKLKGSQGSLTWEHDRICTLRVDGQSPATKPVCHHSHARRRMFESVVNRLHEKDTRICSTQIAKAHSQLIDRLHKHAAIQSIASDLIENIPTADGASHFPAIKGITHRLEKAFQTLGPLGELNAQPQNL